MKQQSTGENQTTCEQCGEELDRSILRRFANGARYDKRHRGIDRAGPFCDRNCRGNYQSDEAARKFAREVANAVV